jgi:hypothetical protein
MGKQLGVSFGLGLVLYVIFSWPLMTHSDSAIPYTSRQASPEAPRYQVMGDHLQLLYHFWLPAEWAKGTTRFGYDLYQFNRGEDDTRSFPVTDYLPFTAVFALFHLVLSQAASWNLVQLITLCLALFWMWRLLQLYEASDRIALPLSLMAVAFPYQWACLFGGSPTGFAMMTVPMFFYGIEKALRQGSWSGGSWAMAALLTAFWTDTHVLLFSYLFGPLWALLVLIHARDFPWHNWKRVWGRVATLLPLLGMVLLTMFLRLQTKKRFDEDAVVGGGWSWDMLKHFSPSPKALFLWQSDRHDFHIYLGGVFVVLLMVSVVMGLVRYVRKRDLRSLLHLVCLAGGCVVLIAFALGTYGPADGWVLQQARRWIPPITMMRQSAKIFAMLAPILALLALPLWVSVAHATGQRMVQRLAPWLLALVVLCDWKLQVAPGISLLPNDQQAYAAMTAVEEEPRALALPLWPGDSAWSSLYQYYASLYRLRMLNGYSPVVGNDYIEEVFAPLMTLNAGVLTEQQISLLQQMRISGLLLHEDAFPEKVSWFPVGATLERLLQHPQVALLEQDQHVWAFALRDQPVEAPVPPTLSVYGSRFQADFADARLPEHAEVLQDATANRQRYVQLQQAGAEVFLGRVDQHEIPEPFLYLRVRGQALWSVVVDQCNERQRLEQRIDAPEWTWIAVPLTWREPCATWQAGIQLDEGKLDLDLAFYMNGTPPALVPGESVVIPARTFYHAGYTDLARDAVVLRPAYERADRVFYGPRWVLPDGRYEAMLEWADPLPPDVMIGRFEVRLDHQRAEDTVEVIGASHRPLVFDTRKLNLPLEFGLYFSREAEVALRGIRVTRLE